MCFMQLWCIAKFSVLDNADVMDCEEKVKNEQRALLLLTRMINVGLPEYISLN